MADVRFWYEFASTYSYLGVEAVGPAFAEAGLPVAWTPFLLGPIFAVQGWNDSPFNLYPAKGRYMWRDLARLCERAGIPLRRPSVFPRNGLLAARTALVARDACFCPEFTRAVFRANFAEDREIGEAGTLAEILVDLGRDADGVLEAAQAPDNKQRLRRTTQEAAALGVFGAPSFSVDDELFWGHDRMHHAIEWASG